MSYITKSNISYLTGEPFCKTPRKGTDIGDSSSPLSLRCCVLVDIVVYIIYLLIALQFEF